jgi:rare lipoprotein A
MIWKLSFVFFTALSCLCNCVTTSKKNEKAQYGEASYCSDKLHGRPTASGRPYDRNGLTAAHHHLPFGSLVRVTHLQNGRSVDVVINDRMRHPTRVIDLSYAAACRLGMIQHGVGPVRLELISWHFTHQTTASAMPRRTRHRTAVPTTPTYSLAPVSTVMPTAYTGYTIGHGQSITSHEERPRLAATATDASLGRVMIQPSYRFHESYEVQFAAFSNLHQAHALQWQLYYLGIPTRNEVRGWITPLHRVLAGPVFPNQAQATNWACQLYSQGSITEALVIPQGW